MARKRKTLPKDLPALMGVAAQAGAYGVVLAVLDRCEPDARGGYGNQTPLMMRECTRALAELLIARGADIDATNTWGRTALHERCGARFHQNLTPADLIELGADIHARSNEGLTPLHQAADGKNLETVELLLGRGADPLAVDRRGLNPLEYALQRMSNVDLRAMVPVARRLLHAEVPITPEAQTFVRLAAERFEFARTGFNAGLVEATAAAASDLCALFAVDAPAPRVMHDGTSPIVVEAGSWREQHAVLWDLLVPPSGPCATVQGEVVRIAGRIHSELYRNGGANWDEGFDAMAQAFLDHVASHVSLPLTDLATCWSIVAALPRDDERSLAEHGVAWVTLNPQPIPLDPPSYRR